jgi:hypothetical protein
MAIRNNTTSLGMGGSPGGGGGGITARQFNDYTARSISTEVARANYRKSVRSDYKVAELRQYVFKMVSSFSQEDKMAILAEYGDAKLAKTGKINEAVTETLIIRLKEEDLQILLRDIRGDEVKLGRKVNRIRSNQKRMASKFGTGSFEEIYGASRGIKGPNNVKKALKAYDKSFKIPRGVRFLFRALRKELKESIPLLFDRVEMTGLATRMQIDFSEGVTQKELINLIIEKTILYVAIITGKTKALYSGTIVDPEPFKTLLSYTSMPYLGGSAGTTKDGVRSLKEEMLVAKARINEASKQRKRTMGIGRRNILEDALYNVGKPLAAPGALIELLGNRGRGKKGADGERGYGLGDVINPLRVLPALLGGAGGGILGALTYGLTLGNKGGMISGARSGFKGGLDAVGTAGDFLKNPFNFDERRLERSAKEEVGEIRRVNVLDAQNNVVIDPTTGRAQTKIDLSGIKEEDKAEYNRLSELAVADPQKLFEEAAKYGLRPLKLTEAGKFKLIREILIQRKKKQIRLKALEKKAADLSSRGKIISAKDKAEMTALSKDIDDSGKKSGTEIPYIKFTIDTGRADPKSYAGLAVPVYVLNHAEFRGAGGSDLLESAKKSLKKLDNKFTTTDASGNVSTTFTKPTIASADPKVQKDIAMDYGLGTEDYSGIDRTDTIFKGLYKGNDPFVVDMMNFDQMFDIKGTRALRVVDVSPVIMAGKNKNNANSDSAKAVFSSTAVNLGIMKLKPEPAAPVYIVNKSLPTDAGKLILGLARILLKVLMPFGGGILADQLDAMASGESGIEQLIKMVGLASGGKGKALPRFAKGTKKSSVSNFIAGDSLNGKPNEEQVSIDWNKKEFRVKPIPSMTSQELNKSGVSQVSRMSSAERNEPMKVYAVNPGITDMIDIGSAKVSMIGLVADMAGRLASIEGLLSIGNQQGAAIVTATAATASNVNRLASKSSNNANPFAGGFPSDLDNILVGR